MAGGTTARRGADGLANILRVIGMAIVAVLVVHIVLTLLGANPGNGLTVMVRDLVAVFDLGLSDLFPVADERLSVLVNYGVAALIWFAITSVVVRLVRRIG